MTQPQHLHVDLFFPTGMKEIDLCGTSMYEFSGSSYTSPKDFTRLVYEKHNLDTCQNCRKRHEQAIEMATKKLEDFPNCCADHKKLNSAPWFKLKDFENFPRLYADKLLFTWHHILNNLEEQNWREEIFDYFEYIFKSFGEFPQGHGEALCLGKYIRDLTGLISNLSEHLEKKKEILKFINDYYNASPTDRTELSILAGTYTQWHKTFPFELSFFSHLKPHFEKNIPFLESTHTNKYLGLTKGLMRTKESLMALLIQITEKVISQINTLTLFESGKIDSLDKTELELILQERKQKLKEGYNNSARDPNTRYRRVLKAWLKDEIGFIRKLRAVAERIEKKEAALHHALLRACFKMQENKIFYSADENTRTRQILDLLPDHFFTKDQSLYGESETGKKQGSVDGIIIDRNNIQYFLEAFNLSYIASDVISKHINKLELNYDSKGLRIKYILVYCNIKNGTLEHFTKEYFEFLKSKMEFKYRITEIVEEEASYTDITIFKSLHNREGKNVTLYHFLIKMPEA